jgi:hypothetical protein
LDNLLEDDPEAAGALEGAGDRRRHDLRRDEEDAAKERLGQLSKVFGGSAGGRSLLRKSLAYKAATCLTHLFVAEPRLRDRASIVEVLRIARDPLLRSYLEG